MRDALGDASLPHQGSAGNRSGAVAFTTSSGSRCAAIAVVNNVRAAAMSRRTEMYTSMTRPWPSTARYTYRHTPADLDVGLIDEPASADGMAARSRRVDQQRCEPLHPEAGSCCAGEFLDVGREVGIIDATCHPDNADSRSRPMRLLECSCRCRSARPCYVCPRTSWAPAPLMEAARCGLFSNSAFLRLSLSGCRCSVRPGEVVGCGLVTP